MTQNCNFLAQIVLPETSIISFADLDLRNFLSFKFDQIVDSSYANWLYGGEKSITLLDYQDTSKCPKPIYDYEWAWLMGGHRMSTDEYQELLKQTKSMFDLVEFDRVAILYVKGYPSAGENRLVALTSNTPFHYFVSKESEDLNDVKPSTSKPRQQPEKQLERELTLWLMASGIHVETQVTTQKHRLDLWIPSKMILELKAGKVTADDVCQAMDYYSRYQRGVLLVGSGLTNGASRGLEAINTLIGDNAVMFVTWGAVKPYLSSVLNLD